LSGVAAYWTATSDLFRVGISYWKFFILAYAVVPGGDLYRCSVDCAYSASWTWSDCVSCCVVVGGMPVCDCGLGVRYVYAVLDFPSAVKGLLPSVVMTLNYCIKYRIELYSQLIIYLVVSFCFLKNVYFFPRIHQTAFLVMCSGLIMSSIGPNLCPSSSMCWANLDLLYACL
jgi:hypothetical protein